MQKKSAQCLAVTSRGLWAQRDDIARLTGAEIVLWPLAMPERVDGFVGWGHKPSGIRAAALARRHGKMLILMEDGFLKGHAPGQAEPSLSFVLDRTGMYFAADKPNDLKTLIDTPLEDPAALLRARRVMDLIRDRQVSKTNNAPILTLGEAGLGGMGDFVLLVDQVAGDASIAAAGASETSFEDMLKDAASRYPGARLVVRTHPAAGPRSLFGRAAEKLGLPIITPPRMNPWPLLEAATAVYTVSSQLGFEALMAGRTVHCFGQSYYSHRGLTVDHLARPAEQAASLEAMFHLAYIDYSRYLDLHERKPVEIETVIDQIATVRDHRNRLRVRIHTGGLSPWKRKALDPFVHSMAGPAIHHLTLASAVNAARTEGGAVALWGSSRPLPEGVEAMRFEDGFIRSRGLGVNLTLPCSLAMDGEHPYYDARGASRLEMILSTHVFDAALVARAERLAGTIVSGGVSKYNVVEAADLPQVAPGRLKILVPGQVEKDASIRFGSPVVQSNAALVRAVRALYPDAFIAYKEHPDVTSGLRSGGAAVEGADLIVRHGGINDWIFWADRIETMTSLTGFEALLRGRKVGVHGLPFYAGWGLTDDRIAMPDGRRGRNLSKAELVAAALILYPSYVHPLSRMPCRVEELVAEIAANKPVAPTGWQRLKDRIARSINRTAVKIRDGRV